MVWLGGGSMLAANFVQALGGGVVWHRLAPSRAATVNE